MNEKTEKIHGNFLCFLIYMGSYIFKSKRLPMNKKQSLVKYYDYTKILLKLGGNGSESYRNCKTY